MNPAQRAVYEAIVSGPRGGLVGPLRAALHNPELADKWQRFGELLRFRTSLTKRHSELAILVTARVWNCSFEWFQHEPHRSDEHTSELQSLMRISYAVFCLKKK